LSDAKILGESLPAGVPLDPATGQPLTSAAPAAPVVGATEPATAGEPTAPASPEPVQSAPAPGVATTPGTDTEQPLGITGQ